MTLPAPWVAAEATELAPDTPVATAPEAPLAALEAAPEAREVTEAAELLILDMVLEPMLDDIIELDIIMELEAPPAAPPEEVELLVELRKRALRPSR